MDSLEHELQSAKAHSDRIRILNELCMGYLHKNPDTAITFAKQALVLARESNDWSGISLSLNRIGNSCLVKGDYATGLDHLLNSLRIAEELNDTMLAARSLNSIGAVHNMMGEYAKAIRSFEKLKRISSEAGNRKGEAVAFNNLGEIYLNTRDYGLSLENSFKAIEIAGTIGYESLKGSAWANIGQVLNHQGKIDEALGYLRKALDFNRQIGQSTYEANTHIYLASVFRKLEQIDSATFHARKAYEKSLNLQLKEIEQQALEELAEAAKAKGDFESAYNYLEKYYEAGNELNSKASEQKINTLESQYQLEKKEAEIGMLTQKRELQQTVTIALLVGIAGAFVLVYSLYRNSNHKHRANRLLIERNQEVNEQKEELARQAENLTRANELISNRNKAIHQAYQNIELLSTIGFKITSSLSIEIIIETVYEEVNKLMDASGFGIGIFNPKIEGIEFIGFMENGEKIPPHADKLSDDQKISVWSFTQNQELFMNDIERDFPNIFPDKSLSVVAGELPQSVIYLPLNDPKTKESVGVITVQSFQKEAYTDYHVSVLRNLGIYSSIAIQKARNYARLNDQREEIAHKNRQITWSITYAKRIQKAILPSEDALKKLFHDFFVIFKPRDIVSGDFYWFHEVKTPTKHQIILAVVDCTGHGIPGAFMSLIGNALLNRIVIDQEVTDPAAILHEMHKGVRASLKQESNDNRDGMDMGIIVFEDGAPNAHFAGARMPLVLVKDGTLTRIKGDRMGIGGEHFHDRFFQRKCIPIEKGTKFYLFSDGFQDQFGGEKGRKFQAVAFRELLLETSALSMGEQKSQLQNRLKSWMQEHNEDQVDDIMVLGGEAPF